MAIVESKRHQYVATTPAMALTREDIKHLRNADDLCFDWSSTVDPPLSHVRCIERAATTGYRDDAVYVVDCGMRLTDYACEYTSEGSDRTNAFEMMHCVSFNDIAKTFVDFLKPCDVLLLHWIADIYGPQSSVRQAGLHADELHVVVSRNDNTKRYTFQLQVRIGPDDTARMIRSTLTRYA